MLRAPSGPGWIPSTSIEHATTAVRLTSCRRILGHAVGGFKEWRSHIRDTRPLYSASTSLLRRRAASLPRQLGMRLAISTVALGAARHNLRSMERTCEETEETGLPSLSTYFVRSFVPIWTVTTCGGDDASSSSQ
eukprot:scaffold8323_cov116-Isochrysis_galbana.AAC.7